MVLLSVAVAWAGDLTVPISGLEHDRGTVSCSLYDRADAWLDVSAAVATVEVQPQDGGATCTFASVPPGQYAVAFHHDANNNGRMDFSMLGLPQERWGVSRDAPARLRRPRFAAAVFAFPGPVQVMTAR